MRHAEIAAIHVAHYTLRSHAPSREDVSPVPMSAWHCRDGPITFDIADGQQVTGDQIKTAVKSQCYEGSECDVNATETHAELHRWRGRICDGDSLP